MPSSRAASPRPDRPTFAERFAQWPDRRIILATAIAAAVVTLWFFFPRFWYWRAVGVPYADLVAVQPEFNRALSALQQLGNPWQPITEPTHRVIEWRLLFPALAHYAHLPAALYFGLPHLGCLLALVASSAFLWQKTRDPVATIAATLLVASTSWFFVSTGWLAYFDSWLVLSLLLASFSTRRWVLFLAALLAPWVDERFILALPVCAFLRFIVRDDAGANRRGWITDLLVLGGGIAPYLAVRFGAESLGWRETSKGYWADRPWPPASPGVILWGAWNGLRLGWVAVGCFFLPLSSARRLVALIVALATLGVNECIADDLSRSASVVAPVIVAGIAALARTRPDTARRVALLLAIGNLFLPAEHVIASPNSVSEPYHRLPILTFYAENARARELPYEANPQTYYQRGMEAVGAGNYAAAIRAFDIALRFAPDYLFARANRGMARYMNGDRPGGMADLDEALARAPWMYESRMQRAAFRAQLGDFAGALEDVQEALPDIPPDWPRRKDAEELRDKLIQQLSGR